MVARLYGESLQWATSSALDAEEVLDALPPTGQYPDDVWAEIDYSSLAQAFTDEDTNVEDADIEDALSPTGQYPDDVWAVADYSSLAQAFMDEEADVEDALPPTGQYPDDVWAQRDYTAYAEPFNEAAPDAAKIAAPAHGGVPPPMSEAQPAPASQTKATLDNLEMIYIIRQVAEPRSGEQRYSAATPPTAAGEGLRYGLVQLRQESGDLGALLTIMQRRDPSLFALVLGPNVAELLRVTTAATPNERLQPVGGSHLWESSWLERFRNAAEQSTFQAAQNEFAIENQFRPMLSAALSLGIRSDRGLAIFYELVLSLGLVEAIAWAKRMVGATGEAVQTGEAARLALLVQASEGTLQTQLARLQNSAAFDGTLYDSLPIVEATV